MVDRTTASPERAARTLALLERDGAALMVVAIVLIGDARQAESAVARVMVASGHERALRRGLPTRQELSASLVRRCQVEAVGATTPEPLGRDMPDPLCLLAGMPRRAQESLALCVYGGLTYARVAQLLRRPREDVAAEVLLGLRHLAKPFHAGSH